MIRGIPVVNNQYAGGRFEWLAPLPVLTGIGLVLGYALLGAGWLELKSEGELREWAWPTHSLACRRRARGAWRWRPWHSFIERDAGGRQPVSRPRLGTGLSGCSGLLAMFGIFMGARRRRDVWPFALTVLFFVASFADARGDVLALHDSLFDHRRRRRCARGVAFVSVLGRGRVRAAGDCDLHRGRLLGVPRQAAQRI